MNKFHIVPADFFIWNLNDLIVFLVKNQNKDIILTTSSEGCSLSSIGLYKLLDIFNFSSVTIITSNIIESHDKYKIVDCDSFKFFRVDAADYKFLWYWNKQKVFGAFYNRPLWHRIGLAAELEFNFSDITLLNFRADPNNENWRQIFELGKLFEYSPESAAKFFQIKKYFPKKVETIDGYTLGASTKEHTDQLAKFYPNILIDIVSETFVNGDIFFVTEKTIRPILLKKPFIVMGPKNFLIYLRQMGFRTFYEYWDENYDGFEGKDKYFRILDIVKTISNKSHYELLSMYNSMQDILDHNYNLLVTQTFNKKIEYIE